MAFAHSPNQQGQWQGLEDHLRNVAHHAAHYAEAFGARELGYAAGLLHDVGKYAPAWQDYLRAAVADPRSHPKGPDHKGAGAWHAAMLGAPEIAFALAGHHGGLPAKAELKLWIKERGADSAVQRALALAQAALPELTTLPPMLTPAFAQDTVNFAGEFFTRMVYSALVDADFLDTERHFSAGGSAARGGAPTLDDLARIFEADQTTFSGNVPPALDGDSAHAVLNAARHEVYQRCVEAAASAPGFYRLTVPTGGGKTRSSLAFALRHALQHGMHRVIYAIPYTSIIEQTADVFRGIFPQDRAVLEHHSAVAAPDASQTLSPTAAWQRLAAENWDAPLIVTTTVQLFESLLGRSPSSCRKLHNIARSVIILDETQMLPTHLLETILDTLRQLVRHYGATIVLCTATQPALDSRSGFDGLPNITDIVPPEDERRLFLRLARVEYRWPKADDKWSWERVAEEIRQTEQTLAIVNTRADALALLAALDDPSAFHLSTRLCGAHRRAVLAEVRRRLQAGVACRLVATQVVEAGVDLDFPRVLRALGPLDRIVQAAGRCNREGKLVRDGAHARGEVIVFAPQDGGLPPGPYRIGTHITAGLLQRGDVDPQKPALYQRYFGELYAQVNTDEPKVREARRELNYPQTAERFRMIGDDTEPVVVRYGASGERELVRHALARLRAQSGSPRELMRQLQPYVVSLRVKEVRQAERAGLLAEVIPGFWEWQGNYDAEGGTGIVLAGGIEPDRTVW